MKVSVRNILVNQGKVLLLERRRDGLWELPGGKVENETVEGAATREQAEETSVILLGKPTCVGYVDGVKEGKLEIVLEWTEWFGQARALEHASVAWWPLDRLPEVTESTRRALCSTWQAR